jgi:hypothetical protein
LKAVPTLRAVIFDHSTIFIRDDSLKAKIRAVIEDFRDAGMKIGVFSSDPIDIASQISACAYPTPDLYLNRYDVGNENKGRPIWMDTAAGKLGIEKSQILYVGDEQQDYFTATNAPTFYIQAQWVPNALYSVRTTLVAAEPKDVLRVASHFMMQPPRWAYSLDVPEHGVYIRSLLDSGTPLQATSPNTFTPLDILRDKIEVKVCGNDAATLLGLHALSSLNCEGLADKNSFYTCYPSSTPGKENAVLSHVVEVISKLLHGYPRDSVLIRDVQAINTSDERRAAKFANRTANVSFADQTNTVIVNPRKRSSLKDRTVIVFDDFTNSGMSLEWARNLLLAAGAAKVVLVSIGKFRRTHDVYVPVAPRIITPFRRKDYPPESFRVTSHRMDVDTRATQILQRSFQNLCEDKVY